MKLLKLNRRIIITLFVSFILLAGCKIQDENSNETSYEVNPDLKLITAVRGDSILVGDMYYDFIEETEVTNHEGEKLSITDLKPGDLIEIEGGNIINQSFPAQTDAIKVVLQSDQESLNISRAVLHFIEEEKSRSILGLRLNNVTSDKIVVRFEEYDLRPEKTYEAVIKRSNNKFKIKEIE